MHDYDDHLATPAEADREYATNVGSERPDVPWILSDRDVWYRNPHYKGKPVPHPEDDCYYETDNQQTETDMDMLRITEQDKMIAVPTGSAAALTDGLAIAIEALKEVALDGHLFDFLGSTHEPVHETLAHLRNILATHGVRKGD